MNEKTERKTILSIMGVEAGGKRVSVQKGTDRSKENNGQS